MLYHITSDVIFVAGAFRVAVRLWPENQYGSTLENVENSTGALNACHFAFRVHLGMVEV
jgi:hypothetical protein